MKKTLLVAAIAVLIFAIVGYWFVMRETSDYASAKPDYTFSLQAFLNKAETDTGFNGSMKNKVILLESAQVKSVQIDSAMSVITLGDELHNTDVICQIDPRYNQQATSIVTRQTIQLQGLFMSLTVDTDLGLGNSIQMNYCSIPQKK